MARSSLPIPAELLTPQKQDVPDDPVRLPEGWLACRTCGVALQAASDAEVIRLESFGRAADGPAAQLVAIANQRPIPLSFALCPTCRHTAELAEQLTGGNGNSGNGSGTDRWFHQVSAALDGLRFVAPRVVQIASAATFDTEGLRTWSTASPGWAGTPAGSPGSCPPCSPTPTLRPVPGTPGLT
jgi:hypothetical protein